MIRTLGELLAHEAQVDKEFCGVDLAEQQETRFKQLGANDPTPTHYFILDQLFPYFELDERSHVLDVGCGAGAFPHAVASISVKANTNRTINLFALFMIFLL